MYKIGEKKYKKANSLGKIFKVIAYF